MTQFSGYLTTEVVEDYSDGIINRREALHRLGLLGVSVAIAVPLLAACGTPEPAVDSGASSAAQPPSPAGPPALPTEAITFAGPESRTLQAAWSAAGWRRAATPRWPSTCCRRRAAPAPSPTRVRSRPPSTRSRTVGSSPT